MTADIEQSRRSLLDLLAQTRRETRSVLSSFDANRVVHNDERAWRVRDVVGHLAVWNGEAARSLVAYAGGDEYTCIAGESEYYDYNGPAAEQRKSWSVDEVWAEYEATHDQLKKAIETMPADRWDGAVIYPWSERGTVEELIHVMMKHEKVDHCDIVMEAIAKR